MLYVEDLKILDLGYIGGTGVQYEQFAKENNLYYMADDMGNHYLSYHKDCEAYIPVEEKR